MSSVGCSCASPNTGLNVVVIIAVTAGLVGIIEFLLKRTAMAELFLKFFRLQRVSEPPPASHTIRAHTTLTIRLAQTLEELARRQRAGKEYDESIRSYNSAVECYEQVSRDPESSHMKELYLQDARHLKELIPKIQQEKLINERLKESRIHSTRSKRRKDNGGLENG